MVRASDALPAGYQQDTASLSLPENGRAPWGWEGASRGDDDRAPERTKENAKLSQEY